MATLLLTYVPVTYSEHVYLNGVEQARSDWTYDADTNSIVTGSGMGAVSGDRLECRYAHLGVQGCLIEMFTDTCSAIPGNWTSATPTNVVSGAYHFVTSPQHAYRDLGAEASDIVRVTFDWRIADPDRSGIGGGEFIVFQSAAGSNNMLRGVLANLTGTVTWDIGAGSVLTSTGLIPDNSFHTYQVHIGVSSTNGFIRVSRDGALHSSVEGIDTEGAYGTEVGRVRFGAHGNDTYLDNVSIETCYTAVAAFPQSASVGEETFTTHVITYASPPSAGHSIMLAYRPKFGGASGSVSGLGASWTKLVTYGAQEIWVGIGCNGVGTAITVTGDHVMNIDTVEVDKTLTTTGVVVDSGTSSHVESVVATAHGIAYAVFWGGAGQGTTPSTGWYFPPKGNGAQGSTPAIISAIAGTTYDTHTNGINAFQSAAVVAVPFA